MSHRRTILVPVDFQPASLHALEIAQQLAPLLGADVVLFHCHQLPALAYSGLEPMLLPRMGDEIAASARQSLDELAKTHGDLATILREGDPSTRILEAAEELNPVMVVMGTHGRGAVARLVLGSVANRVVRLCPAPVLTVHKTEQPAAEAA